MSLASEGTRRLVGPSQECVSLVLQRFSNGTNVHSSEREFVQDPRTAPDESAESGANELHVFKYTINLNYPPAPGGTIHEDPLISLRVLSSTAVKLTGSSV